VRIDEFPEDIRHFILPQPTGDLHYRCLGCREEFGIEKLLYICPKCKQVLLIEDRSFDRLQQVDAATWHRIFDFRKMVSQPALKGIYRYQEFIGPIIPLEDVVYLGEGNTPIIEANAFMQDKVGLRYYFKNDGQNPSASFKDRGMASALSYINYLIKHGLASDILAVCASTGDTSAAAALYAAYLNPHIKSAVLLPHKKITPQQLAQPLGSGAVVFEIPGVFDDCMKIVERLSESYDVALLNSKNAWRILGQESYSYEIAQDFEYDLHDKVVVLPIGNAGNITAVMNGFLKFLSAGIIDSLPKIIGVQSQHANPVFRYYQEPDPEKRKFVPVNVKPSVAQAAMIGNPVSMPRVIQLVHNYNQAAGEDRVHVVEVAEQAIMDWELLANRNGHIACTHGGESLAGLVKAKQNGLVSKDEIAIVDSTAHALKFAGFQQMYFKGEFPPEFEVNTDEGLVNLPQYVRPKNLKKIPKPGHPLTGRDLEQYIISISKEVARRLNLH
jgi:threonine synthase